MELFIVDTVLKIIKDKVLANSNGLMVQSMLGSGRIIKQMEKESFGIQMEMFMMVIGKMIEQTVMVLIIMLMDQNILELGRTINSMGLV
jgi:hypothetical protein